MRVTGHAYPWDVLGDASFARRVAALGVSTVALAAAYHATRAATPLHPGRQLVDARHAALYRPVRASVWSSRRLCPIEPDWMSTEDSFGAAADELRAAGLRVAAWVVLTHNSRLGRECPDVAVVNCFGERYAYALCPSWPEVREYAALLAAEAARDADEVSLEACGQLGVTHGSHHEKSDGAWTSAARQWLSVCCCAACQAGWSARGLDPPWVVSTLRDAIRSEASGLAGVVPFADALLATRHAATDLLREAVLSELDVPVRLHAHPDPWETGSSPGLTPSAADSVASLTVPAWSTAPETADLVVHAARAGGQVDAYVTVLPPAEATDLPDHARRLHEAGATGVNLYHLGLAPRWRHPLLREMARLGA
ncbi:MAG TPA: hypothetical protein VH969_05735 [Actinophytocola sp.]|jgi:hypothetical protein|uniref:hypothetical protein n=1 Tax=Actinophytocola sp. TaxID=1872138 RepID=UPI002F956AAB